MRYLNGRNRITRAGGSGSGNGGGGSHPVATYSQVLNLTQSFDILQVIDALSIKVDTGEQSLFPQGEIVVINGSDSGTNDGLYEVDTTLVLPGGTEMNITFKEANLTTGLPEDGLAHVATDIDVQHDLDTEDIIYRLKNVATGSTVLIDDDSSDKNHLILKPNVPVTGSFRISVIAKK